MSGYPSHEVGVSRGPDTVIDLYLHSLCTLKESVAALLRNYHKLVLQKMECDAGNLVNCNTDSFQTQLADVFGQLNEIETQLNGLEAWSGLPPECFAPIPSNPTRSSPDPDQVSYEAQTLVEVVQRLQLGLRSMVSKPLSQVLMKSDSSSGFAENQPQKEMHALGLSTAGTNTAHTKSLSPQTQTPVRSEIHVSGHAANVGTHPVEINTVYGDGSHPPNVISRPVGEENFLAYTAPRYPSNPPGTLPVGPNRTRSPAPDRRYPTPSPTSEMYRSVAGTNRTPTVQSYPAGSIYNQSGAMVYPSHTIPGSFMTSETVSQSPVPAINAPVNVSHSDLDANPIVPPSRTEYSLSASDAVPNPEQYGNTMGGRRNNL
ncbi:unnamed protein product [Calicophoron daubneyi]|uniref:Uncharacterized protein n=1 Tax=Calicophoron daubneyi TaxID=300641 RepID=A0AAV2TT70_CALDB